VLPDMDMRPGYGAADPRRPGHGAAGLTFWAQWYWQSGRGAAGDAMAQTPRFISMAMARTDTS
jgi:hypothetical protein